MNRLKKYRGLIKKTWFATTGITLLVLLFGVPSFPRFQKTGDNFYKVSINGTEIGNSSDPEEVERLVAEARREITETEGAMVYIPVEITSEGQELLFGNTDSRHNLYKAIYDVLKSSISTTLQHAYTVKINEYTVNLGSSSDVRALLQAALDRYDTEHAYRADIVIDPDRQLNVLTTTVSVDFGDTVEIVDAYLMENEITPLETAISEVTADQQKEQIYEVKAGDTLSQIAEDNGLAIANLVAINPTLDNENSVIRTGDELIITVPEPELSVVHTEQIYMEDTYEADVVYIDNDEWYTTKTELRQQPSAGFRKAAALVTYRNDAVESQEILKEEVIVEAIPKIVERGTKVPPTYIKPISGGRLSSGFGGRKAPKKGASTNHKGIDWATPIGTAVMASSGGTVTRAGWGSGYGYVVYIQHADGRETRYGHLSKVLVSVGQKVSQGQKIALSGNTGRSTGPHLHFEIRINGQAVNPLNYLN